MTAAAPYRVWSDDEVKSRNVVPKGEYPFEIMKVTEKRTKDKDAEGNTKPTYPMWELDFNFWDNDGVVRKIRSWIVFMDGMDWQLRHLAKSINQLDRYEAQELMARDLTGKKGVFLLSQKPYKDQMQNVITDYIVEDKGHALNDGNFDDDIPASL